MIDTGDREPFVNVPLHTIPSDVAFLAPPRETALPQPRNFFAEALQRLGIVRYAVVPIVAQYHRSEPSPLYRDGEMHSTPKLDFDLSELGTKALRNGAPFHLKASPSGLLAQVREAEKVQAFRFPQPSLASSLLCEAPELTIKRVFSGCSSRPNVANRCRKAA